MVEETKKMEPQTTRVHQGKCLFTETLLVIVCSIVQSFGDYGGSRIIDQNIQHAFVKSTVVYLIREVLEWLFDDLSCITFIKENIKGLLRNARLCI